MYSYLKRIVFILSFILSNAEAASTGNVFRMDTGFDAQLEVEGSRTNTLAPLSGGTAVIGGRFSRVGGQVHLNIARMLTDGSVDPAFVPSGGFDDEVTSVAVQADGKIVVGGNFASFNGVSRNCIARLNADGTLDTTFNPGAGFKGANNMPGIVNCVALRADGKILVGGDFLSFDNVARSFVACLNSDGTLDAAFNASGTGVNGEVDAIAVQADGKILAGGSFIAMNGSPNGLVRLNANGTADAAFTAGSGAMRGERAAHVKALALQSDGAILIGGDFNLYNGVGRSGLARLKADGSLDSTFNPGSGIDVSAGYLVFAISVQSDGKIIVGGYFSGFNGTSCGSIAGLNGDGSVDAGFSSGYGFSYAGTGADVYAIVPLQNGSLLVGGEFTTYNSVPLHGSTAYVSRSGVLATTPNIGAARQTSPAVAAVPLPDGRFIVGGSFDTANGTRINGVARYMPSGSLDPSFNPGEGITEYGNPGLINDLVVQTDGKIVVGGRFLAADNRLRASIARFNSDGSLDTSFLVNPGFTDAAGAQVGEVKAVALQADGKIVVGGDFGAYNNTACTDIARLNADGTIDRSFTSGAGTGSGLFDISAVALQPDGKILIGGSFVAYNGTARQGLARLNIDGTIDSSFSPGNNTRGAVRSILVLSDGKILVGGYFTTGENNGVSQSIARLNSDGSLDTTFDPGTGFRRSTSLVVSSLQLQPDGKILVGGDFVSYNGTVCTGIIRLNSGGSLDNTFVLNGALNVSRTRTLRLLGDGRLLAAGASAQRGSKTQIGVALFNADSIMPAFTIQPQGATIYRGDSLTLTVSATGYPEPTLQWYKGEEILTGKTGTTLTLSNMQSADAGRYWAKASNTAGSADSTTAAVYVSAPPPQEVPNKPGKGAGALSVWALAALFGLFALRKPLSVNS
ncbi:MAG: immunoglobulin domain-containing protein [Nibricoccus sp.]